MQCCYGRLYPLLETSTVIVGILTAIVLFLGFVIIYALVLQKYIAKYLLAILIIGNSATLYFMQTYNIEVDKIMMINVFQTDSAEAGA